MQNQCCSFGVMRTLDKLAEGMSRLRTERTVPPHGGEYREELVLREQCHGPNNKRLFPQWITIS